MNLISPKTLAQQGMRCVHRLRELKEDRTACINRIRGLLAEFGVVMPQSPEVLRRHLSDVLEDANVDDGNASVGDVVLFTDFLPDLKSTML